MSNSAEIRSSDKKYALHFAVEYDQILVVKGLLAKRNAKKSRGNGEPRP